MIEHMKDSFAAMIAGAEKTVVLKHRRSAETLRDHCRAEHGVEPAIREREDGKFAVGKEEVLDGNG